MVRWLGLATLTNFAKVRSAENEYENGNLEKENGYDTKRNILPQFPQFCIRVNSIYAKKNEKISRISFKYFVRRAYLFSTSVE